MELVADSAAPATRTVDQIAVADKAVAARLVPAAEGDDDMGRSGLP
jgi:hypothetical protein